MVRSSSVDLSAAAAAAAAASGDAGDGEERGRTLSTSSRMDVDRVSSAAGAEAHQRGYVRLFSFLI